MTQTSKGPKTGDRRWFLLESQLTEVVVLDAQERTGIRMLANASVESGIAVQVTTGFDETVDCKLLTIPFASKRQLYVVRSTKFQDYVRQHGKPEPAPDLSETELENFSAKRPPAQDLVIATDPEDTVEETSKEESLQVEVLRQLRELNVTVNAIGQRVVALEERRPPAAAPGLPARGGVRFSMNEDTEPATLEDLDDEERFLDSLREDTFTAVQTESVRGKKAPNPKTPALEPPPAGLLSDEPATGWQMRDAAFLKALEGNTKALEALRGNRRSGTDDDLLGDDTTKTPTAAKGMARKMVLEKQFKESPMMKYDHVIAMARSEVGIDAANYGDAQIMKKYFQEQVALGKYKMATYVLELVVEIHAATLKKDTKRTLGLLAASYQFLEQYVTDGGEFFMASFSTHQPEPGQYPAPKSDLPLGKLYEREVAAAAVAYGKDVEALRKFGEERAKARATRG